MIIPPFAPPLIPPLAPRYHRGGNHLICSMFRTEFSANVPSRMVVSNYYEHISSTPCGLAMGVDAESLELSWNTSKPTPCLIPPHRCGGSCFKRPCTSRRDTPHERAHARDEHHSPAMPTAQAFYARDGARDRGRAGLSCLGSLSSSCRRRSSVVCLPRPAVDGGPHPHPLPVLGST